MPDTVQKSLWNVRGGSTRGSSHLRSGLPNQDALGKWSDPSGSKVILVVSDGHGSARHFRSQVGSQLGVEAATQVLREAPTPITNEQARGLFLPIVKTWREAVKRHLMENPFRPEEWEVIPAAEREQSQAQIIANPAIAYGATLLAVMASESDILFLQLGDGDILCVDESGATTKPMPEDSRLIANQTTSLCQEDAAGNFRLAHLGPEKGQLPALILISSDGYSNSFRAEEDFLQVGSDYLSLIRQYGSGQVEAQLDRILGEASKKGSGDDITLGFIERMNGAIQTPLVPAPETSRNETSRKETSKNETSKTEEAKTAEPVPATSIATVPVASLQVKAAASPSAHGADLVSDRFRHVELGGKEAAPNTIVGQLRRKLAWTQIGLAGVCMVSAAALALAFFQPAFLSSVPLPTWFPKSPSSETKVLVATHGLRLEDGDTVVLRPGALVDAAALRLDAPFEGPLFQVIYREHLSDPLLKNRSRQNWKAAGPGDKEPHKVGAEESVPAHTGARLLFGNVTLKVVSL